MKTSVHKTNDLNDTSASTRARAAASAIQSWAPTHVCVRTTARPGTATKMGLCRAKACSGYYAATGRTCAVVTTRETATRWLTRFNYFHWLEKLLAVPRQPSLIILDAAKYHLVRDAENSPDVSEMRKSDCQQFLRERSFDLPEHSTHSTFAALKTRFCAWVHENVKYEITKCAEAQVAQGGPRPASLQQPAGTWRWFWLTYHKGTKMANVEVWLKASFKWHDTDRGQHRTDSKTCI